MFVILLFILRLAATFVNNVLHLWFEHKTLGIARLMICLPMVLFIFRAAIDAVASLARGYGLGKWRMRRCSLRGCRYWFARCCGRVAEGETPWFRT